MCGIFGIAYNFKTKLKWDLEKSIKGYLEDACITNVVRGKDSTGIMAVDTKGDVLSYKKAVAGYDFVQLDMYKHINDAVDSSKFIIGHNRAKTRGGPLDRNAHPFTYGDITMVHNGTISNDHMLFKGPGGFSVDSEALCYAISQHGYEEVLPKIRGSFAIVWYDAGKRALFACRNDARPLYLLSIKDEAAVLIGSEHLHMQWLAWRNDLKVEAINGLVPGDVWSIPLDDSAVPIKVGKVDVTVPVVNQTYGRREPVNNLPATNISTGRVKRAAQALSRAGLAIGDSIQFYVTDWVRYNRANIGKVVGLAEVGKRKTLQVEWHQQPQNAYIYNQESILEGEIVNGYFETGNIKDKDLVLTVRNVRVAGKWEYVDNDSDDPDVDNDPEAKYCGPGRKVAHKEWLRLTADGCAWCTGGVVLHNHNKIGWLDQAKGGGVVCQNCIEKSGSNPEIYPLEVDIQKLAANASVH